MALGAARGVAGLVLLVGCGGNASVPSDDLLCIPPPASTTDVNAARILAAARGHHFVDGTWGNGSGTVAAIDVTIGDQLPGSTPGCGGALLVDAMVAVKTRDGLVDAHGTTLRIDSLLGASIELPLPDLPEPIVHPGIPVDGFGLQYNTRFPPVTSKTGATMIVAFNGGVRAIIVADGQNVVGSWSSYVSEVPKRVEPRYEVPADLVTACAPAADYGATPVEPGAFASAGAARAASVATWIRCRAFGGLAHDGIQVAADGAWSYVAYQNGAFVATPGLRRAGTAEVIDVSSTNGPRLYQLDLVGPAVNLPSILSGDLLVVNEFTASSGLVDSVYVRSNLPVTPVQNAFTAGQRAGAAACAVAELGTIDPVDGVPIDTMLAGDWTVCSGEFLEGYRRLRFDQHARSLAFVDEAGVAQPSKPFKLVHSDTVPPSNPRDTTLVFEEQPGGADTWSIMFSERPHKMWVLASSQHAVQRELVLSALAP